MSLGVSSSLGRPALPRGVVAAQHALADLLADVVRVVVVELGRATASPACDGLVQQVRPGQRVGGRVRRGHPEPAGEPRQRQPLEEERAGGDGERDQQEHVAVRGVLRDDERRRQGDHAAHAGPADEEGVGPAEVARRLRARAAPGSSGRRTPRRAAARSPRRGWPQHTAAIAPVVSSPPNASPMIVRACRPISRNTELSSRKAMLRQFIRSAIRDCAVWRIGDLCAEQEAGDDDADHAGGVDLLGRDVRRERRQEAQRAVDHRVGHVLADEARSTRKNTSPIRTPPPAARTKSDRHACQVTAARAAATACAARPGRSRR